MNLHLNDAVASWLEDGLEQIGQVSIRKTAEGFELRHWEDAARGDLASYFRPEDARHLATYTDAREYRPLRTAPNLRHGWRLVVRDVPALRVAIDHFYPAMLGILGSYRRGTLEPVHLRETLARQSGMYAVTRKATDSELQETIQGFCTSQGGCLKTILWRISPETPVATLPPEKFDPGAKQLPTEARTMPLLCHEGCNLLVAKVREVVKSRRTDG